MDPEDPKRFGMECGPDPEDDPGFRALRHRFYRLGKHSNQVLKDLGFLQHLAPDEVVGKDEQRQLLFEAHKSGVLDKLETLINEKEAELREQLG
jgi:hypothetical protein